jgi:hypothetical protein
MSQFYLRHLAGGYPLVGVLLAVVLRSRPRSGFVPDRAHPQLATPQCSGVAGPPERRRVSWFQHPLFPDVEQGRARG